MSGEVYEGSPVGALSSALDGGLRPGDLGIVAARAGVGKSALLVHIALDALLREHNVLHVAIRDTVEHARAHYDEVFRAVAQHGAVRDWTAAMVRTERHRMIHSYLDRRFDVDLLRRNLQMLGEVANFRPKLLVFDGFSPDVLDQHVRDLKVLASELGVPAWVGVRCTDALTPAVKEQAALVLRLTPDGRNVRLSLGQPAEQGEPLSLSLDPTSMLVRREGATRAPSPAARTRAAECTLYSGGARGSEEVFGQAAERYGVHEVNFTFDGHRQERTRGSYQLSPRELAAGDVSLVYVSRRLNRTYSTEGGLIRRVLQTLWHMVSRSQQVFVIGKIQDDGTVVGGTGWSVELARMWNKDLWVYDQEKRAWFRWDGTDWTADTPVITSVHFTGTGTRYLTDDGREAVRELFERSYGA